MVIQEDTPTFVPDLDQANLLRFAAMAAKWKEPARDALDTLVLTSVDLASLDNVEQVGGMPCLLGRCQEQCPSLLGVLTFIPEQFWELRWADSPGGQGKEGRLTFLPEPCSDPS